MQDAVGTLGQAASGYFQQRAQQQELSRQDQALMALLERSAASGEPPDPMEFVKVVGPRRGPELAKAYRDLMTSEKPDIPTQLRGLKALSPEFRARAWPAVRERIVGAHGLAQEAVPEQYDDGFFNEAFAQFVPAKEGEQGFTLSPGQQRFGADGKQIAAVPEAPDVPKPPAVGSFEDFVITKYGPRPTADQVVAARKEYQQADDRPIQINNGPRGLTPNAESALISRLAKDYDAAAKPARELRRQATAIRDGIKAARAGNMNAGQQVVQVAFQKMLDPLSVVREGEFARSAAGQSLLARAQGAYTKLVQGGSGFTPDALEEFAKVADDLAKGYDDHVKGVRARVEKNAGRYNIPADLVITEDGGLGPADAAGADPLGIR